MVATVLQFRRKVLATPPDPILWELIEKVVDGTATCTMFDTRVEILCNRQVFSLPKDKYLEIKEEVEFAPYRGFDED